MLWAPTRLPHPRPPNAPLADVEPSLSPRHRMAKPPSHVDREFRRFYSLGDPHMDPRAQWP